MCVDQRPTETVFFVDIREVFLHRITKDLLEGIDVLGGDEFVAVDTFGFVNVETNEIFGGLDAFTISEENALFKDVRCNAHGI
jgi:hypothetical protein